MPGEVATPDSVYSLITTADAARLCNVSPTTVRSWVRRGKLTASGIDGHNRPMFRVLDVAKAERSTRSTVRARAR